MVRADALSRWSLRLARKWGRLEGRGAMNEDEEHRKTLNLRQATGSNLSTIQDPNKLIKTGTLVGRLIAACREESHGREQTCSWRFGDSGVHAHIATAKFDF